MGRPPNPATHTRPPAPTPATRTQDYLVQRFGRMLVPKVNNTNVDRSLDAIHSTVFGRAHCILYFSL